MNFTQDSPLHHEISFGVAKGDEGAGCPQCSSGWEGKAESQRLRGGDSVFLAASLRDLEALGPYLQGGQHLTKQSAGSCLEGTSQNFLMLAQIFPHREQI